MIFRKSLTLIALVLSTAQASADDAVQWLGRMSESIRTLNYEGTLSYQRGDLMRSLRIVHAVIEGEEYERLEYLDGKKREVLRQQHSLKCVHPGEKLVRFFAAADFGSGQQVASSVGNYYQLKLLGKDRVAGREAVNLQIKPLDEYRYGYRLSLDEETGLMLRSELLDGEQRVLERFQFVDLSVGLALEKADFETRAASYVPKHSPAKKSAPDQANSLVDDMRVAAVVESGVVEGVVKGGAVEVGVAAEAQVQPADHRSGGDWQLSWVPTGFEPIHAKPAASKATHSPDPKSEMLTYTDGMSVFSVFLESPMPSVPPQMEGSKSRGATSAYYRYLQIPDGFHRVTVVGEIPMPAARRIAQSVQLATVQ